MQISRSTSTTAPRFGRNFIILSGGEIIAKFLSFAAFAFLARMLGPEHFGTLEFALAILFVFSQVVDFGTEKYGAVQVAKNKDEIVGLASGIVTIRCIVSFVAFLVLAILTILMHKPWAVKQVVLIYGLSLFFVPVLLQWVFQGVGRMLWVAVFSITRQMVFALLVFLWVRHPEDIMIVALIDVASVVVVAAFNYFVFRSQFGRLKFRLDTHRIRSISRQSWPIFLSQIMMALKLYLPAVLLGLMVIDNSSVGWFRASHRIVFALNTFVMIYLFNLLPSIARCVNVKIEKLTELTSHSIRVTAWSTVFMSVLGMTFAKPLVLLVFGQEFAESARVLQVMIWLVVVFMLSGHCRYILIGFGKQHLDFRSTAVGAGLSLILCLTLLKRYGIAGAVWTMLLSEMLTFGLAYYFVQKEIATIPIFSHLIKPLISCAIMWLALQVLPLPSLWMSASLASILFLITMQILQPTIVSDIRSLAVGIK